MASRQTWPAVTSPFAVGDAFRSRIEAMVSQPEAAAKLVIAAAGAAA